MLKWTVSRSLSTSTSTPHGQAGLQRTVRRPFRDVSNTPPTVGTKNLTGTIATSQVTESNRRHSSRTPVRRRRCRSHGSDLRTYFQATKPNLRASKRQSVSEDPMEKPPGMESFYQSTPRVDSDIGPLTFFPPGSKCSTALTLPTDPNLFLKSRNKNFHSENELPQNIVNEARANLQSHVSDFFQQISLATSPEDVMEADSVPAPLSKFHVYSEHYVRNPATGKKQLPKLAKITKIHARCRTPYHARGAQLPNNFKVSGQPGQGHTPLLGKLSNLAIDQDLQKFENVQNTVTEILNREQEKTNWNGRTVAEILLGDAEERQRLTDESCRVEECKEANNEVVKEEEICKEQLEEENTAAGEDNDSSVSSASQLLEDPSPMASWSFNSPVGTGDLDGEFTLKRQRGIRRKRLRKDNEKPSDGKRAKTRSSTRSPENREETCETGNTEEALAEAINPNVKKLALETDLDSSLVEQKCGLLSVDTPFGVRTLPDPKEEDFEHRTESWELDSPKSTGTDDFHSSKSFLTSVSNTPEVPLLATVRRCLKFTPESDCSRSTAVSARGSIEIEYSVEADCIRVRVIRCKDLRRTYDGPIHAYVKASLKNTSGEGVVKRTAVHRATPNPVFHETLILPCPSPQDGNHCTSKPTSLDIAVWHRDRRARRSELLGCMTLPLPLSQDKEATWHPLEAGTGRNVSTPYGVVAPATTMTGLPQDCGISPPLSKDGEPDNNNSGGADNLTYLRHLELEPLDPLTGLPLHPGFTARGGRTPCTTTRRLIRQTALNQQVQWGFSLSWGRPPRVERVDPGSPAERSGLKPGDYVVFVETTNVVTLPRDEILGLIQGATTQLTLEVYRKGGAHTSMHRPSSVNVTAQHPIGGNNQHAVTFNAEVFPNLAPDAPPEEELTVRENRYWGSLKNGHTRFMAPLAERREVLAAADYMILFQNLDELLKISDEIRDEGGGVECYLLRVPKITAAYRRYLSGLQRACCLLVALRRNNAFAKVVCEPAAPHKKRPDLTGILLLPLEHYREMTRLVGLASPRNCQQARDLAHGYREATANAGVMEPPRDTGRPLLSLQEVESRLVFARCKPFSLAVPGRQWLFGGALAKVEGRGRLQPSWALLLTDLLVFARVSRDRVLFVTEEPLHLSSIAEACFNVRKRPTEFRLQVSSAISGNGENGHVELNNTGGGGGGGGCSPHSRARRRLIVLRAPSQEMKAVWHNLLQRQIIYVNTGYGGTSNPDSPEESPNIGSNFAAIREHTESPQIVRESHCQQPEDEVRDVRSSESIDRLLKESRENSHLAQWVRNSQSIPPPDHEGSLEEWTPEELAARAPIDTHERPERDSVTEEVITEIASSDVEQQSTASSASLSTVKSNSLTARKNASNTSSRENSSNSINICRRCHRSGCPTPPLARDPFSPVPPRISVVPPTPDFCTRHRLRNGLNDSPGRNSPNYTPADGNTEDGSEDELDCDGEPPYRALRRFGTMSSLDQDDDLDEQGDEENRETDSPPSGLRSWTSRARSYVVSKMVLLEQLSEGVGGYLLQPPVPPERTEFSLDANDEEGTTSGATSGDDIWGTPTSGGPDDESFSGTSPPPPPPPPPLPPNGTGSVNASGEDNFGLNLSVEDDPDPESESDECTLPELSMDQLLGSGSLTSLRCFLNRRRLEPLPEEDDSPGSGKHEVGWW